MNYSIIVPLYDEEENVKFLNKELVDAIIDLQKSNGRIFELIFVDDGSKDNTFKELSSIKNITEIPTVLIKHRKNISQSGALLTGIAKSKYENLIFLDGDLQNDPKDLNELIKKYETGFDMVVGWRKKRKDPFLNKTLPSLIANSVVRYFTDSKIHDHGCALKVFKKEIFDNILEWGGDFHRLLAARTADMGFKIAEVVVNHRSRKFGKSNYGFSRILKVLMDLIYLGFIKNKRKSLYYFGLFGFSSLFCSFLVFCFMIYLKYGLGGSFILTPLPMLSVTFFLLGVNFILIGIVAQLITVRNEENRKNINENFIETIIDNRK
jgi:glycosyltransferase involved in cell wall biosynthesis